jgi:hypothetical protein
MGGNTRAKDGNMAPQAYSMNLPNHDNYPLKGPCSAEVFILFTKYKNPKLLSLGMP